MTKITFILIGLFFSNSIQVPTKTHPEEICIAKADAEKILGFPALQTESTTLNKDNVVKHQCSWKATQEDLNSNLYYLDEQYDNVESAHKVFEDILISNRDNSGQSRPTIGDEAWLHSDGTNFCLLMVRKGNKIIRMKVNRLTKETSVEEMKRIAMAWQ
jgi:hypothetical protein